MSTDDRNDRNVIGIQTFALASDKNPETLYPTLSPGERSWRCEQAQNSRTVMQDAWETLKPIAGGRWNKESAYSGLAKFLKATYLAQGYPEMPTDLVTSLGALMKDVQTHMEWVTVAGGRRVQADTGPPCDHVIRVATNCVTMQLAVNFSTSAGSRTAVIRAQDLELISSIELLASRLLDKLGGPLLHEGTFSAKDMAGLQLLHEASAESGAQFNEALAALPLHVTASMSLRVLHGLSLRAIKWTLNYVLARCAKDRCECYMVANDPAGARAASALWLEYARRLAELAPPPPKAAASGKQAKGKQGAGEQEQVEEAELGVTGVSGPQPSALATFMVAEARVSVEGTNPRTLAAMHGAVKAAQEQGDDVVGWLAALNEAQLLVWGAERLDGSFSEDSVQEALDIAAEQRASCRRWGGELFTESRCRAVLDDVKKELRYSHEWAEQLRQREQQAAGRTGDAGAGDGRSRPALLPQGRLPVRPRGGDDWRSLQPVALAHHVCGACGKMFHKTQLCARCKSVRYCGRDCQAAHWKEHKLQCAKLAATAKQAAADAEGGESAAAAAPKATNTDT